MGESVFAANSEFDPQLAEAMMNGGGSTSRWSNLGVPGNNGNLSSTNAASTFRRFNENDEAAIDAAVEIALTISNGGANASTMENLLKTVLT